MLMQLSFILALIVPIQPRLFHFPNQAWIVDGYDVGSGDIPYIVSLQHNGVHFCGGSIVDSITIITAAHCVYHVQIFESIKVVAGITQINGQSLHAQENYVSSVIIHGNFYWGSLTNDIAVLKLKHNFSFNQWIKPIELPPDNFNLEGYGVISGWGAMVYQGQMSNNLEGAGVRLLSTSECRFYYGDDFDNTLLCAKPVMAKEDACQGDSGGPLACGPLLHKYLCGVISSGVSCGYDNNNPYALPAVYTNVKAHVGWIKLVANNLP